MKPMSQLRVERIWQACVAPETITMTDTDYILFGNSHNDWYFSSSHRMEQLIAEARKRKDDDDYKGNETDEPADGDHNQEEDNPPSKLAVQHIDDENANLQQSSAPGSPEDEESDPDELPNVVNLDDIMQLGMDPEVRLKAVVFFLRPWKIAGACTRGARELAEGSKSEEYRNMSLTREHCKAEEPPSARATASISGVYSHRWGRTVLLLFGSLC
ncbi:hypothetical protein R1sor_018954 [Riccia sorocarpa]|uniref:Uncharacterized protein n=1 Tax=Riccia sorocarpa TaxID=122646 RepID=A0ABD3IFC8_9MARC